MVAAAPPATAPPAEAAAPVAPTELSADDRKRDAAREPLATAVVDAYPNWAGLFSSLVARWSPDGKQLVFGSLRDGQSEVYAADPARPASPATAVTRGPERALSAQFTRDGAAVLFMRDTGADENHAIWRVDRDGKNLVNLTPGARMHRDEPLLPAGQPQVMLYSAAKTTAPWRAGVDLFGPADLRQFLLTTDAAIRSIFVAEFGDVDKDAKLLDEFSPMRDVDRIVRPLFVYAGQNDPRVPRGESDTIVKALRGRKVPVEYMVVANEGHSVDRRETKIELLTRLARFVEDALR